ncbi:MAG: leucine-rich repeat protein [Chitinivibrionia bacterium]|nr:leucine-rich repeat protein [Chitinivibrionia bacterium]
MVKIRIFTKTIIAALCVFCGSAFAQENKYWTGDGGKGIRLMVREPKGNNIPENDQWIFSVVQGVISSNFGKFSDITVLDRQKIETIMEEQKEAMSARYADETRIRLGELTGASHILSGNVTKTPNAFMLELSVTDLQSGEQKASYSQSVSSAAFENHSAMGEAAADLLKQLGVNLTGAALDELKQAANVTGIQAQEALARGIVAKRQGTEVAALTYFYQAAALDPSLLEAANRSSVMAVNISSGNIGDDTRNKILWRRDWVARLTEAEQFFDNLFKTNSLPYTLFYAEKIISGDIDYKTETQTLSINTNLRALSETRNWLASVEKSLQAVYDGLDSTKMKSEWGLQSWPWTGVTDLRPFRSKRNAFSIVAELVNSRGIVIGRANFESSGEWSFNGYGRPKISISDDDRKQIKFTKVRADDITDNITIRIASVNDIDARIAARNGVLQLKSVSEEMWDNYVLFKRGGLSNSIYGYNGSGGYLLIPDAIWGESVTSIGENVFSYKQLTGVTIPGSVNYIGKNAFSSNQIADVVILSDNITIENGAFSSNKVSKITIAKNIRGENVIVHKNAFGEKLWTNTFYASNYKRVNFTINYENPDFFHLTAGEYSYLEKNTLWYFSPYLTKEEEAKKAQEDKIEAENARIEAEKRAEENKKKAEETAKAYRKMYEESWDASIAFSVGTTILNNTIDTLYRPFGFTSSVNLEFFKGKTDFIRIGLNLDMGGVPRKWDVIKEEYPDCKFIEQSQGTEGTIPRKYWGRVDWTLNTFIRLYPADGWFLSGGAGFGWYGGYDAEMETLSGDTTTVSVNKSPTQLVFPVGTGFVFTPRHESVSPFLEILYNIVPVGNRTAGYLSVNIGIKSTNPSKYYGR